MTHSFDDPHRDTSRSLRQLPKDTVRATNSSISGRKSLAIVATAALGLAAVNSLAPKFTTYISDLKTKNLPPIEKPEVVVHKPSYLELAKQQGLVVVSAYGLNIHDVVSQLQIDLLSGKENVTEILSVKGDKGFCIKTLQNGAELRPLREARIEADGVQIAFLKPSDPLLHAKIQKNYQCIELSPGELKNQDILNFKTHLAKMRAPEVTKDQLQEVKLAAGVVELRIKNIFPPKTTETSSSQHSLQTEFVRYLRESIGETTFSKQAAIRGTHTTIASKITGASLKDSSHLANLLESRVPRITAGKEFTVNITPVFQVDRDLVIYFGSSADLEKFQARFFPSK